MALKRSCRILRIKLCEQLLQTFEGLSVFKAEILAIIMNAAETIHVLYRQFQATG